MQKYLKFEAIVLFMKRIHAFISGEVQGVGYREEVKRIAFDLGVFGWVMNLEDGRVEIIAEGEDSSVEQLLDRINIRKYPIFVVSIEVEEESYKGEFSSFKVLRDKDVKNEIHLQRDDFKEVFLREVNELHIEINEIKATLARMQAA